MTALLTPVLDKLKEDQDVDVRYFANEAISGKFLRSNPANKLGALCMYLKYEPFWSGCWLMLFLFYSFEFEPVSGR